MDDVNIKTMRVWSCSYPLVPDSCPSALKPSEYSGAGSQPQNDLVKGPALFYDSFVVMLFLKGLWVWFSTAWWG